MSTTERILLAARALFGSKGYTATSVNEIARDAFVTKGAVYHHFGSKEGVFRAVHTLVLDETSARAAAGAGSAGDPLALIQAGVAEFLDALLEPNAQRILAVDGPALLGDDWNTSHHAAEGLDDFRNYLAAAAEDGLLRPVDADAMAFVIRGACFRAAAAVATSPNQTEARRQYGDAIAVLINGLGGRSEQPAWVDLNGH